LVAVEQSGSYRGTYFALMGHYRRSMALARKNLACRNWKPFWRKAEVKEVILATNPTVEGEATAHYIAEMAVRISQAQSHRARRAGGWGT